MVEHAMMLVLVVRFDDHAATHDTGVKLIELFGALAYFVFNGGGVRKVTEHDFERELHNTVLLYCSIPSSADSAGFWLIIVNIPLAHGGRFRRVS
jgi:hypothetical protein